MTLGLFSLQPTTGISPKFSAKERRIFLLNLKKKLNIGLKSRSIRGSDEVRRL